ncbi:MAG: single-stranded DNA-binding protein [Dehalococcoidia bacterium]
MAGLNKIMIIGNVGNDPEMRYTPNGKPMTTFRLATSRYYTTSDGDRRQDTEWFSVVTWDKLAELVSQFLTKGRRAYVEGRLRSRTWEGQDGVPRFRNEIIANQVLFLDRQPVEQGGEEDVQEAGAGASEGVTAPAQGGIDAEELPF